MTGTNKTSNPAPARFGKRESGTLISECPNVRNCGFIMLLLLSFGSDVQFHYMVSFSEAQASLPGESNKPGD